MKSNENFLSILSKKNGFARIFLNSCLTSLQILMNAMKRSINNYFSINNCNNMLLSFATLFCTTFIRIIQSLNFELYQKTSNIEQTFQ
jgi:hypothetical protein